MVIAIGSLEDTAVYVVEAGIVADVSADTVVDPEVCGGCISRCQIQYSGGSRGGYSDRLFRGYCGSTVIVMCIVADVSADQ